MKQSISAVFLVAIAFFTLAAPIMAQQNPCLFKVPLAFSVGMQQFPAGEYRVLEIRQGVVHIRGVDNDFAAYAVTSFVSGNANQPALSKMIFHQYGRRYFLTQVWFDGAGRGGQLNMSEAELREASKLLSSPPRAGCR